MKDTVISSNHDFYYWADKNDVAGDGSRDRPYMIDESIKQAKDHKRV